MKTATTATLAAYFLRLGSTGFGGPIGLAARMQRDLVETRRWIPASDYLDGLAFAQLAPGPLAAQLAMYLGYTQAGITGATVAGLAFVLPSFLMVLALSMAYVAYGGLRWVQAAFYGVGPVVIAIVAVAAIRLGSRVVKRDRVLIGILAVVASWTSISQREIVALFVAAGVLMLALRRADWRKVGAAPAVIPAGLAIVPPAAASTPLLLFFAKASLFVFGSGLAIVPFLYAGVVQERHWLNDRQFIDAVAVAMITPGPVVITVAFIGYLVDGLRGAAAAAIGIFAPVYLMVVILAPVFRRYSTHAILRAFVAGVTAAAAGAIAGAVVVLGRRTIHDSMGVSIAVATVPILLRWKLPEPVLIGAGALIGITVDSIGGLP